jgi:uncharacterized delta-60 repeat protein
MIPTARFAAITSIILAAPLAVHATDPALDSAFVITISPGLTPDGYVPPPAPPNFTSGTGAVNAVALQSNGKIIAGGNISRYQAPPAGSPQSSLKRLNPDGSLDTTTSFNTTAATLADSQGQTEINKILTVAGDKLYVGGVFTSYDGVARGSLMRLNADGSLDTAFATSGIGNSSAFGMRYVLAIAEQPDGKVLVGGGFNRASGTFRPGLARFESTGALDTSFNPNTILADSTFIGDIAVLSDGDILVAGGKPRSGGGYVPLLVRLNSDGSLDPSLNAPFADNYGDIDELLVLPDGRILIGGDFQLLGYTSHSFIACLQANGTIDTAFMANLGSGPNGWTGGELVLQPDGTILAGGVFTSWNNQPRASLARLQPDGTLDTALALPPYVASTSLGYLTHFYSFAVQPDGKLLAGGWFARVSDPAVETYNLTRINNEFSTGPGTLRAISTAVTTAENAGSVDLSISRFGGLIGAVSVDYTLTPLNAVPGTDYTPISGTLTWASGVGGIQTINVPLLQDTAQDGLKNFQLALSNPTSGATLPTANSTTLVGIRDDDSPPSIVLNPVAVSLDQGASFAVTVVYDSVLPATVQWQRDPDGDGPLTFADIPGATSLVYSVSNASPATHAGSYRAVITNPNGSVTSAAAAVSIATPAGSVVTTFAPADNGTVLLAAPDTTGRILAYVNGTNLRSLGADGTFEPTTSFGLTISNVNAILPLSDGRTLVGGSFTSQTHQPSSTATSVTRLLRLNADATGTIDTGFSSGLTNTVTALAAGASGKYYVGIGAAATTGNGLLRYLSTGAADPAWTPAVNTIAAGTGATVYFIKELPDGKVLVSHRHGSTSTGTYRLSRLTSTGTLDTTFGTGGTIDFGTSNWITRIDTLPDGRIAVSARFNTDLLGTGQRYFAILNPDGTRDTSFQFTNGVLNDVPNGIAYRDGRLLVWGPFTTVNGITQGNLARLNLDGSIDTTFAIGAGASGSFGFTTNAAFYTSTGDIFIGGSFTSFKGVARNRAALLVGNPHIGAIGFAPPRVNAIESASDYILTLRRYGPATEAVSITYATTDGTALVGTDYTAANGTVSWAAGDSADKTVLIPLLNDATVEASKTFRVVLSTATGPVGPAASATVTILDDDTPVSFTTSPAALTNLNIGGSLSLTSATASPTPTTYQWFLNGVAISGATSATYAKNPVTTADAGVYSVVATNSAGSITSTAALVVVSPQPGNAFAGQVASGRPTFSAQPTTSVSLPDGGALVGGSFSQNVPANVPQSFLIRIRPDGSTDTSFTLTLNGSVTALAVQPDGKILVGGAFTTVNGSASKSLARLNANLSLDTAFSTVIANTITNAGSLTDLALDSTGRIYLGFNNFSSGSVARVSSTGVVDSSYTVSTTTVSSGAGVTALAILSDDRLLVAGNFTHINAVAKNRLGRLATDGTVDTTFSPSLGTLPINDLVVTSAGRIFVAGGTGSGTNLSEINPDGSTTIFSLSSGSQLYEAAFGSDGRLALARASSAGSGSISRLNLPASIGVGSSSVDSTFAVGTGPNADVTTLAYNSDGSLWIAGLFTTYNGFASGGVIKLNSTLPNPTIVNQPVTTGVAPGGTAYLSVGASGTGLTYQWSKNGSPLSNGGNISGATTAVLTLANASSGDDADYTITVTGGSPSSSVTSNAAHLHVLAAPLIVSQPAGATPATGSTVTLTAAVYAASPATYTWTRDGVPLINGGRYSGTTTASLVITGVNASDNGAYTLTVTNALGTASTNAATISVPGSSTGRDPSAALTALGTSNSTNPVNAILHLPDGRTLIGTDSGVVGTGGANVASGLAIVDTAGVPALTAAGSFNGSVQAILRQPDGKILVAGGFTTIAGTGGNGRVRIARLNADLTLDTSFTPAQPSNTVFRLALDSTGRIYLQGSFLNLDGQSGYSGLVRLRSDSSLDLDFKPSIGGSVFSMIMMPDDTLLVGGSITGYSHGGVFTAINGLVRIAPSGTIASGFTSALTANSSVQAIDRDASGRLALLVNVAGTASLYRMDNSGSLVAGFSSPVVFDNFCRVIVALPSGGFLVGGDFTSPSARLARVNADGTLDTTFNIGTGFTVTSGTQPTVNAIAPDSFGRLWIGGSRFTSYNGSAANRLVILQGEGSPAFAITQQPGARTVDVGAASVSISVGAAANNGYTFQWRRAGQPLADGGRISGATTATLTIANILTSDAQLYDVVVSKPNGPSTTASLTSTAAQLTVLSTPEILSSPASLTREIGGSATFTGSARGASTLTYQWLLNGTPLANGTSGGVTIAGATTPSLTVSGIGFTQAGSYRLRVTNTLGEATSSAAVLTVERRPGSLAPGLGNPAANGSVLAILSLADGTMLVGGQFTSLTINGVVQTRGRIARFLSDGSLDASFAPSFNGDVRALAQDASGNIFVAGNFTQVTFGATTTNRTRVARLTSALALDTAFDTSTAGPNNYINALAPTGDGGVYVGGAFNFNLVGATTVNRVARLSATGALDTGFSVLTTVVNNEVKALLRRSDGKLYVGGTFGTTLLTETGARDTAFSVGTQAQAFLLRSDGNLVVAGGGSSYFCIVNGDTGTVLKNYSGSHFLAVSSVAQQADGKLLSGSYGVLKRTNPATDLDDTGIVGGDNYINALAVDGAGRIWAGGAFSTFAGVAQSRLAILNGGEFESQSGPLTPQVITFPPIADKNTLDAPFVLNATSDSGLPVSFSISGPATLAGSTVTLTGTTGTVTITATQAGNATTAAATPVIRSFAVIAADPLADFLSTAGVPANLRGPNDDADNDGLANLLEYALDLNPNGTGGAFGGILPTATTTPTQLQFTYRRVRNDVTYIVETSPTLTGGTWTSVGVTQGTPGPDGTTTASIPIAPGNQFLRLTVTR